MTIRVRCDGCSAVMKVKDELAGAKGKCPKCKTSFVIPTAKESTGPKVITQTQEGDDNESELGTPADEAADAATQVQAPVLERPIDLPLEPTPPVPPMDDEEFDPMGTLASGSNTALPAMAAEPSEPVNKPSVAVWQEWNLTGWYLGYPEVEISRNVKRTSDCILSLIHI